ncbi:MAG: GH92 family glycosyl hydrolase, partial [Myxococcales bacterium]|nr:GH92 family glycosyl hydrolase [Myxococcales bacterium]
EIEAEIEAEGERGSERGSEAAFDFDRYRARARAAWEEQLAKIKVAGGDASQRRSFYTALYHTMIAPNLFEDVDGRYRGTDLEIHESPGWTQHTVFSLWDTFRAAHPLYTLIEPERTGDFVGSLLAHHRDGGQLAMWELAANYTGCMIGYHAVPVIADAHRKGLSGLDEAGAAAALAAMVDSATRDRLGIDAYRERGHIPSEREPESVSKTLEYAFDDFCVADMAARLGEAETATRFRARAQFWKNVHDPETGLMRPRVNGGWLTPFEPREVNNHYTEANAWQYSFFVPHDVPGLIARHGGREAFAARLDALFMASADLHGRSQPDITGLIGQYAHGNEPSHHVAFLYNHAGQPWKTQARVREILTTLYRDTPDGLPGNEDCGQMSAWYVLSALGLYPVNACAAEYELTTPAFERAVVRLAEGRELVIAATGLSEESYYIQRVTLDGAPLPGPRVEHAALVAARELVFELGPAPRERWGIAPRPVDDWPPMLTAPVVTPAPRSFTGTLTVALTTAEPDAVIHYTLDETPPSRASPVYAGPLTLNASATLRAVTRVSEQLSHETRASFHRRREDWSVRLTHRYNPQYSAGGDHGVIDGLRGTENWRAGGWQGYQPSDFEAVVDLGAEQDVRRVASGYLQDARSWIWLPTQVEYALSRDGARFEDVGVARHDVPARAEEVLLRELGVTLEAPRRARYVRVRARNFGRIPDWHPGRGSPAFIFVDEILVE